MKIQYKQMKCDKHGKSSHYIGKAKIWRCKQCNVERASESRRKTKRKLVEAFGGKCQCCGYDKCIRVLQFHHVDPTSKTYSIAGKGITYKFSTVINEAKKCVLVCANCHGEIEAGIRNSPDLIFPAK